MEKKYKPGTDTFYYERLELENRLQNLQKEEDRLFKEFIKQKGIEIVTIEKIRGVESYKDCFKFLLMDKDGNSYLSIFGHSLEKPLSDLQVKSFDVYKVQNPVTDFNRSYSTKERYTFWLQYMAVTKFE